MGGGSWHNTPKYVTVSLILVEVFDLLRAKKHGLELNIKKKRANSKTKAGNAIITR